MDREQLLKHYQTSDTSFLNPTEEELGSNSPAETPYQAHPARPARPAHPTHGAHQAPLGFIRKLQASWIIEWMAVIASLISLAALVIILYIFDQKPLAKWHFFISLNTVIGLLSATSTSLLLLSTAECISQFKWTHFDRPRKLTDFDSFDQASRGSPGALMFFRFQSLRQSPAALGAFLTLLALAVDPLAQMLLVVRQHSVPIDHTPSSFGYNRTYDRGQHFSAEHSTDSQSSLPFS
jgi:hypothetical protein